MIRFRLTRVASLYGPHIVNEYEPYEDNMKIHLSAKIDEVICDADEHSDEGIEHLLSTTCANLRRMFLLPKVEFIWHHARHVVEYTLFFEQSDSEVIKAQQEAVVEFMSTHTIFQVVVS